MNCDSPSSSSSLPSLRSIHGDFLNMVNGQGESGSIDMEKRDNLAVLTIRNKETKNSITGTMMNQLADIVEELETSKDITGLILRGEGSSFCSGADFELAKKVVNSSSRGSMMSVCVFH